MTFDEAPLLAAIMQDRRVYAAAKQIGLQADDFSDAGRLLVRCAAEQYRRDPALPAVSADVLARQIVRRVGNKDVAQTYIDYAAALPTASSGANLVEEYRLLRRSRAAMNLAASLASGEDNQELLDKYLQLRDEPAAEQKFRMTAEDFAAPDDSLRIPLSPKTLNEFVGGGVLPGHNITVYGRPDSGKSMFALNQAAYLCRLGKPALYVANEEPARDITRRLLARLSNMPIASLDAPTAMKQHANAYGRWHLLHMAGVTIRDIRQAAGHIKPALIVIDQIKNVVVGDDNRALQLDKLARAVRELGIEFNAVTLSVTQAGDSASDKLRLDMGDVDWSNTGIPGAADLMIGIGVNDEWALQDKRLLSVAKNKVNGRHGAVPVWIDAQRTAFLSAPRR